MWVQFRPGLWSSLKHDPQSNLVSPEMDPQPGVMPASVGPQQLQHTPQRFGLLKTYLRNAGVKSTIAQISLMCLLWVTFYVEVLEADIILSPVELFYHLNPTIQKTWVLSQWKPLVPGWFSLFSLLCHAFSSFHSLSLIPTRTRKGITPTPFQKEQRRRICTKSTEKG